MHHKHKIIIKKRDYARPKRLFYQEQKERIIPEPTPVQEEISDRHINNQEVTTTQNESEAEIGNDQPINQSTDYDAPEVRNEHLNEISSTDTSETKNNDHRDDDIERHKEHSAQHTLSKVMMALMTGLLAGILLMSFFNDRNNNEVQKNNIQSLENSAEKAIARNKDNIVSVTNLQKAESPESIDPESAVKAPEEVGIGSGVIYKIDNNKAYILTNYHVVGKANKIEVAYGNQKEKAKLIGYDVWTDMAVLTIPKGKLNSTIKMADSKSVLPGQTVYAMGSPLGQMFAGSASSGIISGLSRSVPVDIDGDQIYDWEMNVLQTDAAINPGNSGGPLLNNQGKMIGLNTMKISMEGVEGLAFSIPSNDIKSVLKQLEEKGSITRPKLGILVEDIGKRIIAEDPNSGTDQSGVEVVEVEPQSSAEKAGLMVGDQIMKINHKEIESKIHFRKILFQDLKIGDTIKIEYIRNGKQKSVKVKL